MCIWDNKYLNLTSCPSKKKLVNWGKNEKTDYLLFTSSRFESVMSFMSVNRCPVWAPGLRRGSSCPDPGYTLRSPHSCNKADNQHTRHTVGVNSQKSSCSGLAAHDGQLTLVKKRTFNILGESKLFILRRIESPICFKVSVYWNKIHIQLFSDISRSQYKKMSGLNNGKHHHTFKNHINILKFNPIRTGGMKGILNAHVIKKNDFHSSGISCQALPWPCLSFNQSRQIVFYCLPYIGHNIIFFCILSLCYAAYRFLMFVLFRSK